MIPTPYTLQVKRFGAVITYDHGNPVEEYGDPVAWPVHAIAPGAMAEPGQANRDLSLIEFTVYAPVSDGLPGERDLVVINSVDYQVNGRPGDWSRGPWVQPNAGVVVELIRAEG